MRNLPTRLDVTGLPVYVESWSVARIPGFVLAVLERWQRNHGKLPTHFAVAMCPQAELNARGGLPARVVEITDAKLRCAHFTGCHKPYFFVIFAGADAKQRCTEVLGMLAWSEGYAVELRENSVMLEFLACTEDIDDTQAATSSATRLQELISSGELVRILE